MADDGDPLFGGNLFDFKPERNNWGVPKVENKGEQKAKPEKDELSKAPVKGNVNEVFATFVSNPKLSDITFVVGDEKIPAHRVLLALRSPVFEAMLYPDPAFEFKAKGKEALDARPLEIRLPDTKPIVFQALLRCVYTDELDVDTSNIIDYIAISTKYQVEKMRVACATFMERDISVDNVCDLFEMAPTLLGKPDFGFPFIREHTEEVLRSKGFVKLSKGRVRALLSDEKLSAEESDLFEALIRWGNEEIKRSGGDLKQACRDLLQCVRFPLMPVSKVAGPVVKSGLLDEDELLAVFQYVSIKDEKIKEGIRVPFNSRPREGRRNAKVTWDAHQSFTHNLYDISNKGSTARKARNDGTIYVLRSDKPLETKGKHYVEYHIDALPGSNDFQVGLAMPSFSFTGAWLQSAGAYYVDRGGNCYDGTNRRFGGAAMATGDRFGFMIDYKTSTVELLRGKGMRGGKMEKMGTWTGISQQLYPVFAARSVGAQITAL